MHRRALLMALLLCVQGCGIKGPLYIETAEQRKKAEERRARLEAAKRRDTEPGTTRKSAPDPAAQTPVPAASTAPEAEFEPATAPDFDPSEESFGPSAPPH